MGEIANIISKFIIFIYFSLSVQLSVYLFIYLLNQLSTYLFLSLYQYIDLSVFLYVLNSQYIPLLVPIFLISYSTCSPCLQYQLSQLSIFPPRPFILLRYEFFLSSSSLCCKPLRQIFLPCFNFSPSYFYKLSSLISFPSLTSLPFHPPLNLPAGSLTSTLPPRLCHQSVLSSSLRQLSFSYFTST